VISKTTKPRINTEFLAHFRVEKRSKYMKATGIVCRIDDLGRVVIPKEIRRTMRIREGDPLDNSLTLEEKFAIAVHSILKRYKEQAR
jgi:AbrB family looped-hinge helix DNA binding protein